MSHLRESGSFTLSKHDRSNVEEISYKNTFGFHSDSTLAFTNMKRFLLLQDKNTWRKTEISSISINYTHSSFSICIAQHTEGHMILDRLEQNRIDSTAFKYAMRDRTEDSASSKSQQRKKGYDFPIVNFFTTFQNIPWHFRVYT